MAKLITKSVIKPIQKEINLLTPRIFDGENESIIIVYPKEISYIRGTESGTFFYLVDGEKLRSIIVLDEVEKEFKSLDHFTSGDENHLINLHQLKRSTYERGEYRFYFKTDEVGHARLTPRVAKKIAKKLKLPSSSLKFINHYKRVMKVCQRYNIRLFEDDITGFTKERLLKEFVSNSGKFVMANLLYNLIWQIYTRMINKEIPEDEILIGNIRSFWYTYYKSILSKLNMIDESRYGDMIEAFTRFTVDWKLFKYRDWEFWDSKQYNKKIGKGKRKSLILVGEKEGQIPMLEMLHRKLKISTIALGGEPSILSVEYFVDDLEDAGIDKDEVIHLFFATDYDPVGMNIQKSFVKKLKRHYFKKIKTHNLITLDIFTQEQIDEKKYALIKDSHSSSNNWVTRVKKWVKKTGGIGKKGQSWKNKAYGMELEASSPGRLMRLFEKAIKPYF